MPVVVKNGTGTPGLAQHAVAQLKLLGYTDVQNGGNADRPIARHAHVQLTGEDTTAKTGVARTVLLDTGVPNPDAPSDIALILGVSAPVTARRPVKPNKIGWTPPAAVFVTLGQDYASSVLASGALQAEKANPGLNGDVAPTADAGRSAASSAN